jgi:5-methylcytosine-specific restriction protein A
MSTFLLAWNPTKFPRGDLYAELASVRLKGKAVDYWSTWSREIASGDRLFLIRLGDRKRGIVGAGWAVEEPTEADHWDPEKASQGKKERYVGLVFDYLREEPLITWQQLQEPPLSSFRWGIQRSGVSIPQEIAVDLERHWVQASGFSSPGFPDEVTEQDAFLEGGRRSVTVNRYERDPAARAAAIAQLGVACSICRMNFLETYGSVAANYIQVHHVVPLGGAESRLTIPADDLRPICPNCHAVVHLRVPPYSLDEVRSMLWGRASPS